MNITISADSLLTGWYSDTLPETASKAPPEKGRESPSEAVRLGSRRSIRDAERLLQGHGAVFSIRRAAELMHGDDKVNRRWLRAQEGLIRKAANGDDVVIWGEVLDRLPRRESTPRPRRSTHHLGAAPTGLRRVNLGSL